MSRICVQGSVTNVIRIENLGKSSQMPTVSSIQFVSPELSDFPGATVVQQD